MKKKKLHDLSFTMNTKMQLAVNMKETYKKTDWAGKISEDGAAQRQ